MDCRQRSLTRWGWWWILLVILLHGGYGQLSDNMTNKKKLYIGGIFPMTGSWAGGQGCKPAVEMALRDVNKHSGLLADYKLEMVANDTQCLPGLGMKVMYDLLYTEPTKVMLLGPGCSVVSTFVGQAARMWNLVVMSYGSSSPALSNRKRFRTFFRTHPSATLHNPTRVKLFQKFGWKRIATIQATKEVFTSTVEDLEERVKHAGIEIAVRTSFLVDPKNAVRNLKRQDARIIVGLFYENMARRVFCEAYKQKMYGPKYVWWIIGWYKDNWYTDIEDDETIDCTVEQMKEVVEGHFTTEGVMLNQDNIKTISGVTAGQFISELKSRVKGDPAKVTGYVEGPLAYDAVWALALALNKTSERLQKQGKSLEDFTYESEDITKEIYSAMNATNFIGVSGRVAFSSDGDRIAWTQVEQLHNGNYNIIGYYDYVVDNLTWYNKEVWTGSDRPPQDRTIVVSVLRKVSQSLFIGMCGIATMGIIAGTWCLVFNVMNSHRRYIRFSQPNINNVLLAGCIVCLMCVYLQGLDGRYVSEETYKIICQIRAWSLSIGFTLAYGSMFSKIWIIYRLTTRRKKDVKMIHEWELYVVVCILLLIDVVVLTVWQILDPLTRRLESFPHERPEDTERDIELKPLLEHCSSVHINIWLGVVFGYKGVLLLFGILLAYETRSVKIKQVNDSRFVGMSVYNVVVLCMITAPVTLIIGSQQDATFAFVSLAIILSCFLTMGLIFVPKVMEVHRSPRDGVESTALTDSAASREEEERQQRLQAENEELKKQIALREERVRELKMMLQQRATKREQAEATPSCEDNTEPDSDDDDDAMETANLVTINGTKSANHIAPDHNSDSALQTSSTAKSSKTSGSEENYSEAYT